MISQERLKELFYYDEDSGEFTRKASKKNWREGTRGGWLNNENGYRFLMVDKKVYREHRLIWLYVHGYFPEWEIDHINRIRHDNRLENLREVNRQCNVRNSSTRRDNTSGIKGVSWHKRGGKWAASIVIKGKSIYLGLHEDLTEAVAHRLAAEQAEEWHGCDSNSSAYKFIKEEKNA